MDGGLITSQGGGGGSVGAGLTATIKPKAGNGGNGNDISITGVSQQYGGGGGGLNWAGEFSYTFPNIGGGTGVYGGGNGPYTNNGTPVPGTSGTPNTGGGGGGNGYSGGSGIVIIKVISPTTNKYLFFNYLPAQPTLNYTLNFPTRTIANFNNSGDEVMNGQYTVSVRTTQSTITPTQGQNLQDRLYFTSNLAIRYHTLNPVKTAEGAQWTYSSNNPNVYHLGSVGIGTTSPEYSLDVRGFIYSSSGGYTSSALTKWSVFIDLIAGFVLYLSKSSGFIPNFWHSFFEACSGNHHPSAVLKSRVTNLLRVIWYGPVTLPYDCAINKLSVKYIGLLKSTSPP